LFVDGPQGAFLPAPIHQAATWSKSDLKAIGKLLCKEVKTKAAQVLNGPNVCCVRNPLGGRNFEAMSEDPFLSGTLAIKYVAGLQETGEVMGTAKHLYEDQF
jgi:beta-glucosidase